MVVVVVDSLAREITQKAKVSGGAAQAEGAGRTPAE